MYASIISRANMGMDKEICLSDRGPLVNVEFGTADLMASRSIQSPKLTCVVDVHL